MFQQHKIGIIGGSGLYQMNDLKNKQEVLIETPYGKPSGPIITGTLAGQQVYFIARHGSNHRYLPSEVPYAANIFALKTLGVDTILSVSAVGSLKQEIAPGHIVLPDQFYDRTKGIRRDTFFGQGVVAHVSFGKPVEPKLSDLMYQVCQQLDITCHKGGTYVCMEGPQFSTKAESQSYRAMHFDVIGMTNLTEAKLAREAEIAYVSIALSTDYDCWHESADEVTTEAVLAVLKRNVENAQKIVKAAVEKVMSHAQPWPESSLSLRHAVMTHHAELSPSQQQAFKTLLGHYEHYYEQLGLQK